LTTQTLSRSVGFWSASFIVTGYVVGATIFILPGSLAPDTGPAVFIAYALAAIPAVIAGFVMAQIGSAVPVSGSIFILVRDALSPLAAFFYLWIVVSMGAVVIPLVAFGFADYLGHFLPGLDTRIVAALLVLLFVALNAFGMNVVTTVQNVMVVAFIGALLLFGIGGIAAGDPDNLRPLFPKGHWAVSIAAITAYFSYTGVFVIAEIAGEVRDPGRNIPRAILFAFVLIIIVYTVVPLALMMVVPWNEQGNTSMPVVAASARFLPDGLVTVIAVSALLAGATTVNGILMGLSRDLYQGARNGLFPSVLAGVNEKSRVPGRAVAVVGALAIVGVAIGGSITSYAQLALIGLMIIQVLTGIALIRMPTAMPDAYRESRFRLNRGTLTLLGSLYIAISIFFLFMLSSEKPRLLAIIAGFLLVGAAYRLVWGRIAAGRHTPGPEST
jgi:APA family basic amino acid/polyamine antiporter